MGSYTTDTALSAARDHFRNSDFGYSAALYKKVVELSPKNPEGYIGLGASYDRLGRFDLSDRVYASLFALSGGTAQYFNNVGYSYMLRGNLTSALTNFRKAPAARSQQCCGRQQYPDPGAARPARHTPPDGEALCLSRRARRCWWRSLPWRAPHRSLLWSMTEPFLPSPDVTYIEPFEEIDRLALEIGGNRDRRRP